MLAIILAARKKDFEPANRQKFCSRIATGDYDAVIIGHSQFEKIPLSDERQKNTIIQQIDEIENGLLAAAEAEAAEIKIYRQFSETAANEGFKDISDLFLRIADVEERHETIFRYLYEHFRNGTLFSGDKDIIYECSNCGFRFTAKQAFSICPLCKVSQGFVKIKLPE